MGYDGRFSLTIDAPFNADDLSEATKAHDVLVSFGEAVPDKLLRIINSPGNLALGMIQECDGAAFAVGRDLSGGERCSWYEHEEDLRRISRQAPTVLFTLSIEGPEADDLFRKYFKAGKCQIAKARIEYDEFDEGKLR